MCVQVMLMLTSDLEDNERDKVALNKVLSTCLKELTLEQMVNVLNVCQIEKKYRRLCKLSCLKLELLPDTFRSVQSIVVLFLLNVYVCIARLTYYNCWFFKGYKADFIPHKATRSMVDHYEVVKCFDFKNKVPL